MPTVATDRLARIRALEEQRAVLAAEQAAEVAALVAERRAEIEVEIATVPRPGVGSRRRRSAARRQLIAEIALARRISPWQAQRFVTWACSAPVDTPETFALVAAGALSEHRAMTVGQIVAPLDPEQRRRVDTALAPHLPTWGDRKVDRETRAAVYRVDPGGACDRAAYAADERRVSFRPAPETMGWLSTLVPLPQLVAIRAALEQAAREARGRGDLRSRGQIMADTVVERVTGQAQATAVPLAIQLVVTDRTLLGASDAPARFADGAPVSAPLARALVLDTDVARRVRRLFTDPAGRLITAETSSRAFTSAMADFIALRDGSCTTDWCDAPVRHVDHDHPRSRGGPTSLANARGKCVWCNETKSDRITAEPAPPTRPAVRRPRRSPLERQARRRIAAAKRRRPEILVSSAFLARHQTDGAR